MKIRLIQSSHLDEKGTPVRFKKLFMPALTLPTLAALTPKGVTVHITEDAVEEIDYDEDVDLVGITAMTSQATRAYQIADEFRKRGTKTIMGGIHASACPQEALQHVDAVLVGEAENIWDGVLKDAAAHTMKTIYKDVEYPDLSNMVLPRFDLLNFRNYVVTPFTKTPMIPVQATRGCPNRCNFCSVTAFLGHKIRKKPVSHVIREIEHIQASSLFFTDDNIGADPQYAKALFKALIPLKKRWTCQMSTTILRHPELIELAAAAGCHEVFVGIESLDSNCLQTVQKGFNKTNEYKTLFRRLKEVGILGQASFIFGFDGDTPDTLRKTALTVLDWDIKYLFIFILTPFPGTGIHRQLDAEGRIRIKDWSLYDAYHPVIEFKNVTSDDLLETFWDSYQQFYSTRNIVRRFMRFGKQYIRFFPRDFVFEDILFSFLVRNSVNRKQYPFSLGLSGNGGKNHVYQN